MKLLFLDIDGVLNSQVFYEQRHEQIKAGKAERDYPLDEFCPKAIELINRICRETGAKVVVSSTWRHGRTVEQLQTLFNSVGATFEVVGKTPDLCRQTENGLWLSAVRGDEIKKYTDESNCKSFVILDDDGDMLDCQRENFIQTSWLDGLTEKHAAQAVEILGKHKAI